MPVIAWSKQSEYHRNFNRKTLAGWKSLSPLNVLRNFAHFGLMVATHTWSDAVALAANMHLVASLPTGLTVEIDRTGNELIDGLLTEPFEVSEGEVQLRQAPGLGIDLDQEALTRYTLPRTERIPHGVYS